MTKLRHFSLPLGLAIAAYGAAACFAVADTAAAELPTPDGAFDHGAAAYLAGDHGAAALRFAEAISHDPQDPRPYYFRALCLAREGRNKEARSDFMIAASLEAQAHGAYPVSEALRNLAADDRSLLEQFRWHGRIENAFTVAENGSLIPDQGAALAMFTDAGVLRQKASVPLDRLVQPISLDELASLSAEKPPTLAAQTGSNPFADDHHAEVGTGEPAAKGPDTSAEGTIPSGKLLGIVGRAVMSSAPVPSLDRLRDAVPDGIPLPNSVSEAPTTNAESGAAAVEEDDPFAEPAAAASEEELPTESAPPAEAVEEDPFG